MINKLALGLVLSSSLYGCGKQETPSSAPSTVTLEGIIYLEPLAVAESVSEEPGASYQRRAGPRQEAQVLSQGQVEAYCAAAGPFRECPPEGEYISRVRVSSSGEYQINVSSSTINDPGITLVARDEDGNVAGGAFVHSELYPTRAPPRQDISPESTSATQGLYGTLQRAQEEFRRVSREMYGRALQGYNDIFELVRDCFRQSTTLNVRSVFDKIIESEEQRTELGDIYRNRTGGSGDSASIGQDIAERARRIDLGGGSYIIVEKEGNDKDGNDKDEKQYELYCDWYLNEYLRSCDQSRSDSYLSCRGGCSIDESCLEICDQGNISDFFDCCAQAGCVPSTENDLNYCRCPPGTKDKTCYSPL